MDINPLDIVHKVWQHTGVSGYVWTPRIINIGDKKNEDFKEGRPLDATAPDVPELRDSVDWYWTPGISSSASRRAKEYPAQRAVWVDCDDSYNDELLAALRPSFMWETSPGHKQAVWLLRDKMPRSEFNKDGFIGMLTQALGADKSGVDVGQLLRVPGTMHHKRKPFRGRVLRTPGTVYTRGQLLSRVAKGLGFSPALASELGADDPYGDRSKLLWKFSRNAAELGLPQDLAFKLIKATKWNKWSDDPDRLKEDIGRAYEHQPERPGKEVEQKQAQDQLDHHEDDAEVDPWGMDTVDTFGKVLRKPISWVVPNIIPEAGCGLLVAAPKVGKTRIAIEIALGLATGRKPLGIGIQGQTSVGFFSLEDGEYLFSSRLNGSLNRDQGRHRFHWDGHIKPDLSWHPPAAMELRTHFSPIDLSDDIDKQRLYNTIVKYDMKLVIIDTLSMAIGKANVSDQKDMYAILKDIKIIAKATGCAIMFIHHTRKRVFEKGESIQESILGATALHAWSDFIMSLASPEEDSDLLRLGVQTKMGSDRHFISQDLKIIKHYQEPVPE